MPTQDAIAKTINGPNETQHIGVAKLRELQDVKWGRLKSQDMAHLLRAARYIQLLYDEDPDGWVITNGDDTKARCPFGVGIDDNEGWTPDLDKATWFARKDDAERFAAEDEDAWHIRKVSDVRVMWGARTPSKGPPASSTGVPRAIGGDDAAIATGAPETAPVPPTLPVCQLSDNDLLRIFRQFVTLNATQWAMGAGDHHHPIWETLAEAIDGEEATFGPDWAFVQPMNRKRHQVLLAEYIDLQNSREAEERGG